MSAKNTLRLGIDLGGTKIHAAVVDGHGTVRGTARSPTKPERGYAQVVETIHEIGLAALGAADARLKSVASIGLGVPGPVDQRRGVVLMAANLGWGPKPIARDLGRAFDRPVVLGNDANFGALGEVTSGAAAGIRNAFAAFVGTGLGGALISRGRVVNGAHGYAGEIGHIRAPFGDAPCGCGRRGCLETVASKTGIARLIAQAAARGERCLIKKGGKLKSSDLRQAWKDGCPVTTKAIGQAAEAVGWGLANVGNVFDPEVFILGGGVIEALGKEMLPMIRGHLVAASMVYGRSGKPDLRLAALGDDAVAVGAAVAASEEDRKERKGDR